MTWIIRQKHFLKFENRKLDNHALTQKPEDEAFGKLNNALIK